MTDAITLERAELVASETDDVEDSGLVVWGHVSGPVVCVRERGTAIREALKAAGSRPQRSWREEAEAVFVEAGHQVRVANAMALAEEQLVPCWVVELLEDRRFQGTVRAIKLRQLDREWVRRQFPPGVLGAFIRTLTSKATQRTWASYLERFAAFCRQLDVGPFGIRPDTLVRYRDHVRARVEKNGWSSATFAQHITSVRSLVRWLRSLARRDEVLHRGLVTEEELEEHFWIPPVVNEPPVVAKPSEVERLLKEADGDLRLCAALTLLYCCLRLEEVATLRIEHIQERGTYAAHVVGKGKKSRWVPLPESAHARLSEYLESTGRSWSDRGPLLVALTSQGVPRPDTGLTANHLGRQVRALTSRLGIRLTPHSLRHGYAQLFFQEYGGDVGALRQLQRVLGHEDFGTTLIYLSRIGVEIALPPAEIEKALGSGETPPLLPEDLVGSTKAPHH